MFPSKNEESNPTWVPAEVSLSSPDLGSPFLLAPQTGVQLPEDGDHLLDLGACAMPCSILSRAQSVLSERVQDGWVDDLAHTSSLPTFLILLSIQKPLCVGGR